MARIQPQMAVNRIVIYTVHYDKSNYIKVLIKVNTV